MPDYLKKHLENRCFLVRQLRSEIVGPDPTGLPVEIRPRYSWEEFRMAKRQVSGEELLWQDPPTRRYGAGILYPVGIEEETENLRAEVAAESLVESDSDEDLPDLDEKLEKQVEKFKSRSKVDFDESEDYAVSLANAYKPAAIGLSFICDLAAESVGICIEIANHGRISKSLIDVTASARYKGHEVEVEGQAGSNIKRKIWARIPLTAQDGGFPKVLVDSRKLIDAKEPISVPVADGSGLCIVILSRGGYSHLTSSQRLVTVSLVNYGSPDTKSVEESALFQAGLHVSGQSSKEWIIPYPENLLDLGKDIDPLSDSNVNALLYRKFHTFAVGHGCATDWLDDSPNKVGSVWTDVMPSYETPSISSDLEIKAPSGELQNLRVSMWKLAGLDTSSDGFDDIDRLIEAYSDWIDSLKQTLVTEVSSNLADTGLGLIKRCEDCLVRIRRGRELLESKDLSNHVVNAFRMANKAMLISRLRGRLPTRYKSSSDKNGAWSEPYNRPDLNQIDQKEGYWRPFQIAFVLLSLDGIVNPDSDDRNVVDLIWFPTGGGKTEAYLGLTAFTIFFNRLTKRNTFGSDVIMRYTLRLLTAQQFQRAALLFCAMESIRWENTNCLGEARFTIGLWVGGTTTPNSRAAAIASLNALQRDNDAENPFVLLRCPWCGSKFGSSSSGRHGIDGYEIGAPTNSDPMTVLYRCSDDSCEFGKSARHVKKPPLPVMVIDDDLFDTPPNLLIGTVDKFAMLAWNPSVRRFFGIDAKGKHPGLPPSLIIQDELHLISGPLGSMVGLYETIIEVLCRKNGSDGVGPKIVASTATISRSREQIKHLYARENSLLFPPSGLDAEDSFFSKVSRNKDGALEPGRQYLGIMAPGHGSLQTTQKCVYASLSQNAALINDELSGVDPWWTLLCFYNSIRELGSAATLFVTDVREYLRIIIDRHGLEYKKIRKLFNVSELTSRIRSDQVPKELARLERSLINNAELESNVNRDVIDACLASNIIEVGVDVSRLSVMAIIGQPKTTSQYIQVSSRVGRDPRKPGLVAVLYGQSKPRDRSHYERFRQYHQKIYSHVEPTSVTPFSPPAVDRALHGLVVSLVRQLGNIKEEAELADPFPLYDTSNLKKLLLQIVCERVEEVCPEELPNVLSVLKLRLDQWKAWNPREYGNFKVNQPNVPLMYPAGYTIPETWDDHSWPTMSSLRNVDATCEAEVTQFFNTLKDDENE